jgi:pimeloyl-ACP methyl ester carboxylesterase
MTRQPSNTKQIAKLIGPTLIALAITESIDLRAFGGNTAPVVYLNGTLLFVAGLSIVLVHNVWTRGWPVLVTLIGWFGIFAGLGRMIAPESTHSTHPAIFLLIALLLAVGVVLTFKAYGGERGEHRKKIAIAVCATLLVVAVGTFLQYRADITRQWQRISTDSLIAETPCGRIEYAVAGSGPAVLVVHGAGGGFDQGLDFARALTKRSFKVIAVSRFGYLRTPLPHDASAAAQADAHLCLMNALSIDRASVVGFSAGAPSALQFAIRHPNRTAALFLLVPAAYHADAAPAGAYVAETDGRNLTTPAWTEFLFDTALKSDFLFWLAIRTVPDTVIGAILGTPPELVPKAERSEQERVQQMMDHILPVSPRGPGLINDARVVSKLPRYELERIQVPTLIISVKDDRYGTYPAARYTADHIPGARFVGYEQGGHIAIGHNQEILEQAASFLQEPGSDQDNNP